MVDSTLSGLQVLPAHRTLHPPIPQQQTQQQPPQLGTVTSPMPQVVTAPSSSSSAAAAPGSYASRVPSWVLRGHRVMGLLQLLTGIIVISVNIVGLVIGSNTSYSSRTSFGWLSYRYDFNFGMAGGGVWSGPFFIAAGISGLSAGRPNGGCTLGCVITCLVFSIIASTLAFSAMVTEAVLASENLSKSERYKFFPGYTNDAFRAVYGTGITVVLLCAFEFVLAIVHSAYACRASCCCVPSTVSNYQHQQPVFAAGQQAYFTSQAGPHPGLQMVFYTAQTGHPQQPGYPVPQSVFQGQPPGYPGQPAGYPGQQLGYPGQQPGYPGQQPAGYPGQQPGYPGQQPAGYPGQQPGYPAAQASGNAIPPSYESVADGQMGAKF